MTAFDDLTTALTARLKDSIAATPNGQDPNGSLYALLADLNQLQGGGGGSSSGLTQAQVKAAIESATNIDGVEGLLSAISSGAITQAQVKAAIESAIDVLAIQKSVWISRSLTSSSSEYSASAGLFTFTCPTAKRWQFISAYVPVTTSGTAGTRLLQFGAGSGGGWVQLLPAKATQTAGQTRFYNLGQIPTDTAFDGSGIIGLTVPPLMVDAAETFVISIAGFQSGDAPVIRLKVAEWST